MPSTPSIVLCAVGASLLWTCIGLAVGRAVLPDRSLVWPLAPALGWALQSAASLPIFFVVGFSSTAVRALGAGALLAAIFSLRSAKDPAEGASNKARVSAWAWMAAALLAIVPALAVLPKPAGAGLILAAPIFDHAKVALIDEIARLGVPPGNPFLGNAGQPLPLAYYYLWHYSAAELAVAFAVSGWEADVALTWFSAFSSLLLMIGLACWFSARAFSAVWVLLCSLAGSLRPLLEASLGPAKLYAVILPPSGFAGWLFQAAWVPQHLAAACCVVLANLLMVALTPRGSLMKLAVLALVVAAGFESSTWVGGVTFAIAAPLCALALLAGRPRCEQQRLLIKLTGAAVLALILSWPLLRDQITATSLRGEGPIALEPMGVFEDIFSEQVTQIADLPGYWLVLLNLEFPAIYLSGGLSLLGLLAARPGGGRRGRATWMLAALLVTGLMVAWLLASSFGDNNDLGWRAVLPSILLLSAFAAVGVTRWLERAKAAAAAALLAIALGLGDGLWLTYQFAVGRAAASAAVFAQTPQLWAAVRRHAGADDRVGNNPLFLQDMTGWPVNISWALMANRRSCFAGKELALAFAPLSEELREDIDAKFIRVFAGHALPADIEELANRYQCRVIVVTYEDGAFAHDPFATSAFYRLAEAEPGKWRIYLAQPSGGGGVD